MAKVRITQIKSKIGQPESQKKILAALGLRKMHQTVEHEDSPNIMGMVSKLKHLVKVEKL
ncbi:MAG: 50S ribosomal protein L30 [Bacteroidetes bacterium]|nr:MAG: 50S ribosomal protein L30 [Bacteroidota bacterium]